MGCFWGDEAPKNAVLYIQGIHNKKEKNILKGFGFTRDPECKLRSMDKTKTSNDWETKIYLNYRVLKQS